MYSCIAQKKILENFFYLWLHQLFVWLKQKNVFYQLDSEENIYLRDQRVEMPASARLAIC